eukprot:CAMPEP_0113588192 /NCGR_PEP_ID=MMETSP0015_2-20120614/35365_1 /TAXON_ID=2838 /ORGANISM="Odontella" /LENGTH=69 /DNA_ID=CAMNT_0000494011 /DNA_START=5 /DNA_END=210 /DNA_ORIENTATION=- /assembly_acc=CAM_ASM_000160
MGLVFDPGGRPILFFGGSAVNSAGADGATSAAGDDAGGEFMLSPTSLACFTCGGRRGDDALASGSVSMT